MLVRTVGGVDGSSKPSRRDDPEPLARRACVMDARFPVALHTPVHPTTHAHPHVYRNALLAIGAAAIFMLLITATLLVKPVVAPSTVPMTEPQSLIEFRAGERAAGVAFRAAEREMR
jgi:hypothetical protein